MRKSIQEGKIFQSHKFFWNHPTFGQGIHSPGKINEQLACMLRLACDILPLIQKDEIN